MNLISNDKYDIDVKSDDNKLLLISVYDYKLANRLNRILNKYKEQYIRPGEEAMYIVSEAQFNQISKYLASGKGSLASVQNWYLNDTSSPLH